MRPVFLSVFFFASVSFAAVRFDPPNPTSRTPVTAHVVGTYSACSVAAQRHGSIISIDLANCDVPSGGPIVDVPVDLGTVPAGVYDVIVGAFLVGLDRATLVVRDANPPFQLSPNVALVPTEVALIGHDIPTDGLVRFGDIIATVISAKPDKIVVRAPQHDPGIVDVTIERGGKLLKSTAVFYYVPNYKNPDPAFYEPVLLPVSQSTVGAFGALWATQIYMRNENDFPLVLWPIYTFNLGCFFECATFPEAHSTRTTGVSTSGGILQFVPRQAAAKIHFGILVKDLRHQAEALGTEIPTAHEKDFFDHPLQLLNVPTNPQFRIALRVYDLGTPRAIHFIVEPLMSDEVLVSSFVYPTFHDPSFAQISDLVATFPDLAGKGPVRITVEPPVSGAPSLWAFITVTNNQTQHVTTISPQ